MRILLEVRNSQASGTIRNLLYLTEINFYVCSHRNTESLLKTKWLILKPISAGQCEVRSLF